MKCVKNLLKFLVLGLLFIGSFSANAAGETLEAHEKGTFDEYIYKISLEVYDFKKNYNVKGYMQKKDIDDLIKVVKNSFEYLPDNNLKNQSLYRNVEQALEKAYIYNGDMTVYTQVLEALESYVKDVSIGSVKGKIYANPTKGPAPHTVTLKGEVRDEAYGLSIPERNYVWYINKGEGVEILGRGRILKHTFYDEGYIDVFLAVKSSHINSHGKPDVKNFGSRVTIEVQEPAVNFNIKVNNERVREDRVLKFTPAQAKRGLMFDATSSTPSKGRDFTKTTWDFGNGVEKEYNGRPKVETVKFTREGRFKIELKLRTNEGNIEKKEFDIEIRDPLAHISASQTSGYIGDTITFSTKTIQGYDDEELLYNWKIIDINEDKLIYQSTDSLITHNFKNKGRYNVQLFVTGIDGEEDVDNQIIEINSRAPQARINYKIPQSSKPNTVFLDGTDSFDPDVTDKGRLEYIWTIDGVEAQLTDPASDNSTGYYTFSEVGNHNVTLEVIDPDGISSNDSEKVLINSVLSVDFSAYPRVAKIGETIRFKAISPNAKFYEWKFGDGLTDNGINGSTSHSYKKSGEYLVELTVLNEENQKNSFRKKVYVADANSPYAVMNLDKSGNEGLEFRSGVCSGNGAYIADRVSPIQFKSSESTNVNGESVNLEYSWKIANKFYNTQSVSYKFDELGCFPAKLTVRDKATKVSHSVSTYIKVENVNPVVKGITISPRNLDADPVVVDVEASGAYDPDGVVQSFLWYYYTDTDKEPQSFRATSVPNTSFVLPKITGNYYFVLVMKDSNGGKTTTDSREEDYYITLEGDNINTPIVSLTVDNSSIFINEEVTFNVGVKNILGQNLSGKASYFWDFDGDGLYDLETQKSTVTHKFERSGNFKSKVKVRYKGISNTKTKSIDVANKLTADFEYISFGDKVVLVDRSKGSIEKYRFDLGDGNIKSFSGETLVHEYSDNKKSHDVKLSIQEGTQLKNTEKEVRYNVLNQVKTKENGLHLFTFPALDELNQMINLSDKSDELYVYLGESKGEFSYYGVDFDLEEDSDLNGISDDDVDNLNHLSYTKGTPVKIELSDDFQTQRVRVFLLGEDGESVIETKDFTIIKEYISDIDVSEFRFEGISDEDLVVIEKVKANIELLPKNARLEASKFIQKLENGWFDEREKTQVILDLGNYISGLEMDQNLKETFFRDLESLIVSGDVQSDTKEVAYTIIKSMLPASMVGYDEAILLLDEIKAGSDIEANRTIGKDFLNIIANTSKLTSEEKLTIKDQLKIIIYHGSETAAENGEEISTNAGSNNTEESSGSGMGDMIFSVFVWLGYAALGLISLLFVGLIVFFILYKFTNKDPNLAFSDFIIEKTYAKDDSIPAPSEEDELAKALEDAKIEADEKDKLEEESVPAWMQNTQAKKKEEQKIENLSGKEEAPKEEAKAETKEELPDWLKPKTPKVDESKKQEEAPKEEAKAETKEELPDWLKPKTPKVDESKKEEEAPKEEAKAETKEELPDWLKPKTPKVDESKNEEEAPKEEAKAETKEELPDWLKPKTPKVDESKKEEEAPKEEAKAETKEELPDWLKPKTPKVDESKKEEEAPKEEAKAETKEELPDWLKPKMPKVDESKKEEEAPKEEAKAKTKEELPDWLKPKTPKVDESKKEEEAPKEEAKAETKEELPDWLKESVKKSSTTKEEVKNEEGQKEETEVKEDSINELPEWLKESVKKSEGIKDDAVVSKGDVEDKKAESDESSAKTDDEIPDWLKTSISNTPSNDKDKSVDVSNDEIPDWLKTSLTPENIKEAEDELAGISDANPKESLEEKPKKRRGRPPKKKENEA